MSFAPPAPQELTAEPFDDVSEIPGERVLVDLSSGGAGDEGIVGGAVGEVIAPSVCEFARPVQLQVTNYRLKLFEPAAAGASLRVTLCRGFGLKACDAGGTSDPYAVITIVRPGASRYPKRTRTIRKTVDPVWDETFMYEGVDGDATLKVTVYDDDRLGRDDYMGEFEIPNVTCWDDCAPQRTWSVRLPVTDHGKPGEGYVKIRLHALWHREGSGVRHCSVPLLMIDSVKADLQERPPRVEVMTKAADQLAIHFYEQRHAAMVAEVLSAMPSSPAEFFCNSADAAAGFETARFRWGRELARWTRQNATGDGRCQSPDGYARRWCLSEVNHGFGVCSTYSEEVVLPTALTAEELTGSAKFRKRSRFPMVAWIHPSNYAVLCRSSQPQTGSGLGKADGAGADRLCLMRFCSDPGQPQLTIADARPFLNAEANRWKGGGTESDLNYEGCVVEFLNIDNIHDMRKALNAVRSNMGFSVDYAKEAAALTGWLAHVGTVLRGAARVAATVESGESVLVHCSDGWDRTSQLVSLASLLLDGHYRTISGFTDLIEKDWLQPGHKFRDRCGLAPRADQKKHANEASPIFTQFLECVVHLWRAYPRHFQYTPRLLSFVLYHSFSGRFHNFLGNCEQERRQRSGPCLFAEIKSDEERWRNTLYEARTATEPIVPCVIQPGTLSYCGELYGPAGRMWGQGHGLGPADGGATGVLLRRAPSLFSPKRGMTAPQLRRLSDPESPRRGSQGDNAAYIRRESPRFQSVGKQPRSPVSEPAKPTGPVFCGGCEQADSVERLLLEFLNLVPNSGISAPTVAIDSYVEHGTAHVEYTVKVSNDTRVHVVSKRYSLFYELSKALKRMSLRMQSPFPPKSFFPIKGAAITERRIALNEWFREVVRTAVELDKPVAPGQCAVAVAAAVSPRSSP
eukprot:TRINITY_DN5737_c0_g1_i1.p1 TRINITY_DN5737_c0_g1~~TRINITY_DN5737_c0_g1_i1.p1  ORF type:complete len:912 (+),score=208.18 TRINITY_DN5737_c0_g1_i1:62-2797(+)